MGARWASDQWKPSRGGDCPRYEHKTGEYIITFETRLHLPNINWNRGFIKCSIDGIDRNRIEGIGCITADIDNNTQPTGFARFGNRFMCDEWRDLRAEVNAVHKYINIEDLVKGATLGCFRQVPLEDVVADRTINNPSQGKRSK